MTACATKMAQALKDLSSPGLHGGFNQRRELVAHVRPGHWIARVTFRDGNVNLQRPAVSELHPQRRRRESVVITHLDLYFSGRLMHPRIIDDLIEIRRRHSISMERESDTIFQVELADQGRCWWPAASTSHLLRKRPDRCTDRTDPGKILRRKPGASGRVNAGMR